MHPSNTVDAGAPATVLISRLVNPGRGAEFRSWLNRLIELAEATPEYAGLVVITQTPEEPDVCRLVHRFANDAALKAWEESPEVRRLSAEADAFSTLQRQATTGMEAWFSIDGSYGVRAPKKWKMATVTFVVVYGLTALIIPRETEWLPHTWTFYEANIITNVLIAALMTYVIMPVASRLLRRWLY